MSSPAARSNATLPPSTPAPDVADAVDAEPKRSSLGVGIATWLVGLAALAAVVIAAQHVAEPRAFVAILERAQPAWIAAAVALQLGTYAAQAQVWRAVAKAGGARLPFRAAYELSLAKLFVDQALPSGGLSGTLIFVRALEQRGLPRPLVYACVVVDAVTFYGAYAVALVAAIAIAAASGHLSFTLFFVALAFVIVTALFCVTLLVMPGRKPSALLARVGRRIAVVGRALHIVTDVDAALVHDAPLLARTFAAHAAVIALDSSTMWVLLLALGTDAPPALVFASFMGASLLRTVGVLPGGLGTFDATAVLTLSIGGVPVAAALSATLAFRVLSFWLPMIPGLFASRAALASPERRAQRRARRRRRDAKSAA